MNNQEETNRISLIDACRNNQPQLVENLICGGYSLEEQDRHGNVPLMVACACGSIETATLLLKHGARIDSKNKSGFTALMVASERGHDAVVRLLIAKGATIEAVNDDHYTSLHLACIGGHLNVIRALLQHGARTDTRDKYSSLGPLEKSCKHGHGDVVELLLDHGADIEGGDRQFGGTPLTIAARNGRADVVERLLSRGANIDAGSSRHSTAFVSACMFGSKDIADMLLRKGTIFDGDHKRMAVWAACYFGHLEILVWLSSLGVPLDKAVSCGDTPLHLACDRGHENIVEWLLSNDVPAIDAPGGGGETPLYNACGRDSAKIVSLLLERGADLYRVDGRGETPLHNACRGGSAKIVSLLLERGADIYRVTNRGSSPLHRAFGGWNIEIVKLLLEQMNRNQDFRGINSLDDSKLSPLHLACERGNLELVKVLLGYGADINNNAPLRGTPLMVACVCNQIDVVDFLLSQGAEHTKSETLLHQDGEFIWSLPQIGCQPTYPERVEREFCETGKLPPGVFSQTFTPLHCACFAGYDRIVKLLLDRGVDLNTSPCGTEDPLRLALRWIRFRHLVAYHGDTREARKWSLAMGKTVHEAQHEQLPLTCPDKEQMKLMYTLLSAGASAIPLSEFYSEGDRVVVSNYPWFKLHQFMFMLLYTQRVQHKEPTALSMATMTEVETRLHEIVKQILVYNVPWNLVLMILKRHILRRESIPLTPGARRVGRGVQ